ncbi:hypothetical protein GHU16_05885 [Pseudomonas aeruginosa]|nr:hypothetical protein [Pseudomonas aeruginosa]RRI12055.1 hypothetical protein EIL99_26345 [Pseudomonas aeruginosa]RRJ57046.1 hypothetical protein EIM20_26540 [Pseudomonas aeruginosa]
MHAMAPYSIRVYNPNLKGVKLEDRYALLDKVGQFDAYAVLRDHLLAQGEKFKLMEEDKQVYRYFGINANDQKREIAGWFEFGTYGVKNDIIDVETGVVDFEKTQKNAEIVRHYIRLYIPAGFNEGIALLHSFKGNGIKTVLYEQLRAHFHNVTKLNLQLNPLAYNKAFELWKDAVAKEIKLVRFSGMGDITDQIKRMGHDEHEQELIIKPPRRKSLGKLVDFFTPGTPENATVEVLMPLCSQLKTTVTLNGKTRTFNIGRPATEQVCEVEVDEDDVAIIAGNPEPQSLHDWCTKVLGEFVQSIYPGMGVVK